MNQIPTRLREDVLSFKRERILREAVQQFYARGFTGTTLDSIAQALGVTKPFIYTHFRGKTELLAACCLPTIEMSYEAIANAAQMEALSFTDRLERAITDFTKVILERQANIAVFFREEKHLDSAAAADIDTIRRRFDQVLSELIGKGREAGEFSAVDSKLAALALGGMISWIYTWYHEDGRLDADSLAAQMAGFSLHIVGARAAA
jgi:AcrR family transcriptional regulator